MDASDLLSDPKITLMGLFVEAYTEVMREISAQERAHDLSVAEFDVLLRLGRSPGSKLRITDLVTQTGLTSGGMTRLIDRLDKRGLVERVTDPTDRRVVLAHLTPAGAAKNATVIPGHLAIIERTLMHPLTPTERTNLEHALRKIRDHALESRPNSEK
ncbi:MarR family winged helix-turn-helix transcriptional regulator [Nocardia huaxiensis]|uniref:MarR family transcriptional regulator n=1 Tax=Nocardia huaxiensis TaxID=2755382 RepID=A0A7D6V6W8_9NOCA|nr:MarR family transcriptional regulator [Nocardia huaxiensis]QLY28134.1 MarR family transcriptional regulator [Nocardia huaxiensis]UFS98419.1 MarR family transcriptional regulator [Nocardia huaxiensis]